MKHPIVRMFYEEIRMMIDQFIQDRLHIPPADRRSLVVILRGLPGCGKSTFAILLKIYAEAMGLEIQNCSADSYFITIHGYKFDKTQLGDAHARSVAYCSEALERRVPVVVIDNTNVTQGEWSRYVKMARKDGHAFCRVSFEGDINVRDLLARSWNDVPQATMEKRLALFREDNDLYAAHFRVPIRLNVFAPQEDEEDDRNHPMELIFFELIREQVDAFARHRAIAIESTEVGAGWTANRSLVFVLRGLPGCGKPTFALVVKVYAQALGLETLICSSDDYFRGRHGFRFDPTDLDNARQYCIQWLRCALFRHVSVVVVDDQHITAAEWEPVLAGARLHQVVFVNFVCPTMELAQQQIARAFTHRT